MQILQNRYQLVQQLGQRAGRRTWLAEDTLTQTRVVIKQLIFNDLVQWDHVRLFEREAQLLRQLKHPRIPAYQDYFCIDDQVLWFCLVQDYIPGMPLNQWLTQNKRCNPIQAQHFASEILQILVYLHQLSPPVLHRDIKPSNLILGENNDIYLIDFGAVQDRAAAAGATFTIVGTYGYAPLEQFGGRATPASDLYALGATLIHLLTGTAPADLPQHQGRIQFADRVHLNPGFVRWLERLTEPDLERRFNSAKDALKWLQDSQTAIAITHAKPLETRIRLRKTADRLVIKIPRRSLPDLILSKLPALVGLPVWLSCFWTLGRFAALPQSWFWATAGVCATLWYVLPACGETLVRFDNQQFEIKWLLFGICVRRRRDRISNIDHIFRSEVAGLIDNKVPEVTLSDGVQEFSFGRLDPPLTEAECRWLIEELSQWLGLES